MFHVEAIQEAILSFDPLSIAGEIGRIEPSETAIAIALACWMMGNVAPDDGNAVRPGPKGFVRLKQFVHKARMQETITDEVSANRHLRENNQISVLSFGVVDQLTHGVQIGGDVAGVDIELCECDVHSKLLPSL